MLDGFRNGLGLAMAGKNPWGSPGKGNGGSGSGDGSDGGDTPSGGDPDGPRNPWLPGGSPDKKPGGRRSASIDDIFKGRGPGGPRREGGGGFRIPERPGGGSWVPIFIAALVALWAIFSSAHLIQPGEQAVVKTFGNYSRTLEPGLKFTAPWPIETISVENTEGVRAVSIPDGSAEKLILTGDQNLVDLSYIVRWRINNLRDFRFQLAEPERTVNEVAEAAMRASVAEKSLDETFTGQGRAEIEQSVRERMQETLNGYRAGIEVVGVQIEKADPPGDVVEAFRDVSVAQQNADKARNDARGYAQGVLNTAEGEAEAFTKVYEQYRLAPGVTRQRLYYETMERILSQTDKTVIEANGVTPYLPLPEIRRRAAEQPPQITVQGNAPKQGGQ